jgi:hypothetical protein
MPDKRTVYRGFKYMQQGKKSVGKPINRWLDDFENNLKKMGVTGWRKRARDRDAWKLILKEIKVLHGP